MMGSYRYLAQNIGLLTISNLGTKLLSFFLVPLYTSILTTTEYGTYDLFNTTIGVLVPVLSLNIMESVMRFAIDKESDKNAIFIIGCRYFIFGIFLLLILLTANHIFQFFPVFDDYVTFFFLMFLSQVLSGIVLGFARGLDKIADVAISGIICSIVMLSLNIFLLVYFKMGLIGYFIANIMGPLIQDIYLLVRIKFWKYLKRVSDTRAVRREMLSYSKPLIANSVAWWINNLSDRYIVILICGLAENGIYSVAAKIPSVLNIFQTIFNQAWTLSAVKDFDPKDQSGFFSEMYNSYNCLMCLLCSGLILCNRFLAKILYAKDFYAAWKYMPFLMLAIVFGALSGYIGGVFSAVKDSKIFAKSTVIGAVANIIMNIIAVPFIGALGAAIATAISYWMVWLIRIAHMRKYLTIRLHLGRDYIVYGMLTVQALVFLIITDETLSLYAFQFAILFLNMVLFRRELKTVFKILYKKMLKRYDK